MGDGRMDGVRDYPAEWDFESTELFRYVNLGRFTESKDTLSFGKIRINAS